MADFSTAKFCIKAFAKDKYDELCRNYREPTQAELESLIQRFGSKTEQFEPALLFFAESGPFRFQRTEESFCIGETIDDKGRRIQVSLKVEKIPTDSWRIDLFTSPHCQPETAWRGEPRVRRWNEGLVRLFDIHTLKPDTQDEYLVAVWRILYETSTPASISMQPTSSSLPAQSPSAARSPQGIKQDYIVISSPSPSPEPRRLSEHRRKRITLKLRRRQILPEAPALLENPALPETPALPEVPALSETPTSPRDPHLLDTPALLEAPALLGTPAPSEVPAILEAPALPANPTSKRIITNDPVEEEFLQKIKDKFPSELRDMFQNPALPTWMKLSAQRLYREYQDSVGQTP